MNDPTREYRIETRTGLAKEWWGWGSMTSDPQRIEEQLDILRSHDIPDLEYRVLVRTVTRSDWTPL